MHRQESHQQSPPVVSHNRWTSVEIVMSCSLKNLCRCDCVGSLNGVDINEL